MIICKWFLDKLWRSGSCHWSTICHHHHWHHLILILRLWRLDNIDFSSNKFKFSILIFFTTVIINSDPATNISFSLIRIQCDGVISRPSKTCCPVCNLTWSCLRTLTKNFPVQCWKSKESIWNWWKLYGRNVFQRYYTCACFKNKVSILRE